MQIILIFYVKYLGILLRYMFQYLFISVRMLLSEFYHKEVIGKLISKFF